MATLQAGPRECRCQTQAVPTGRVAFGQNVAWPRGGGSPCAHVPTPPCAQLTPDCGYPLHLPVPLSPCAPITPCPYPHSPFDHQGKGTTRFQISGPVEQHIQEWLLAKIGICREQERA